MMFPLVAKLSLYLGPLPSMRRGGRRLECRRSSSRYNVWISGVDTGGGSPYGTLPYAERVTARGRRINTNQEDSTLRTTVADDLGAGGIVAQALPGYEERPAQIQMALDVAAVLESGEHAIIEASTGTGKSIAYLIPIVRSG